MVGAIFFSHRILLKNERIMFGHGCPSHRVLFGHVCSGDRILFRQGCFSYGSSCTLYAATFQKAESVNKSVDCNFDNLT